MNLINPSVSRAMASMMKTLSPKDRYTLSGLALKFTDLDELPGKWQVAIKAEMAKNAVTNAEQDRQTD
jgi:lipopolysaccharide/colanic/teichoic acid biosynthesis glycosyltransferase